MYGLTRAVATLLGVAVSGVLVWLASDALDEGGIFEANETGRYWGVVGLLAGAGFVMALSQLLGGWTKWGWPRISGSVFLIGFLPALVAGGWVLLYVHPGDNWLADTARDSADDLGIENLLQDLSLLYPAIAFALGLLLGLTLDTSGPRVPRAEPVVTAPQLVKEREERAERGVEERGGEDRDDETVVEPPRRRS
jgi:hypothetical protein